MINVVLVVLLILLIRTEFTLGGVLVEKCCNCNHIIHRKGFDDPLEEDYHYCTHREREVEPSDPCCECYE